MLIGPVIPEIQLFQKLTLKIQGQGHGWGQSSKSKSLASYRPTSLWFRVNRPSHSWDTAFSKLDIENQRSRSWVRSQHSVNSHPFPSMSIGHPIPELLLFEIWPWKSRVKVMGEVTVQSHNVGLTSYRLTSLSFHVNQPSHSWDTAFSKFDLENPRSRLNDHDDALRV